MSEHTKEPWSVNFTKVSGAVVRWHIAGTPYGSSYPVCEHLLEESISGKGPDASEQIDNARRIVACVNACAGRDIDVLEETGDIVMAYKLDCQKAEQQRDNLLAAAKITVGDLMDSYRTHGTEWFLDATKDLRNAIAEIEASK